MKTRSGAFGTYSDTMLEMSRTLSIFRTDRPTIFLKNDILTSHINHRLNADAHSVTQ